MKVQPKESELIQKTYLKYRSAGFPREMALQKTSQDTGWGRTTCFDHTVECDTPNAAVKEPLNYKQTWPKTVIFTAWEIRVGVDKKFVQTLQRMAEFYSAELFLVPCQESDVNYIPKELTDVFTVITEDIKLNDNVQFKFVETNALLASPLSGHKGAYPDSSTIIPGLIKEVATEPSQYYVKQLLSTGSVGYLNARVSDYSNIEDEGFVKRWRSASTRRNGRTTAVAQNFVVPSALIVDILDKKTFVTRYVTSVSQGVVYDLDKKFTPSSVEASRPSALVVGDTHAWVVDEEAIEATKAMITSMKPSEVIVQDFWDGISTNHHIINDPIKFKDSPSIEEEAEVTKYLLKQICDISEKVIYLQSNHDNFLEHYLSGPAIMWRLNHNYNIACDLQSYRIRTGNHPIVKLLDLDSIKNLEFVRERDDHYVGRVLVKHGHEGQGGVRAGFMTMAKTYNYYVQAHLHSPAVFRNAAMAGLTAQLDQDYAIGASNWLHSNIVIQPDNSLQLLPIINGKWGLDYED